MDFTNNDDNLYTINGECFYQRVLDVDHGLSPAQREQALQLAHQLKDMVYDSDANDSAFLYALGMAAQMLLFESGELGGKMTWTQRQQLAEVFLLHGFGSHLQVDAPAN